MKIKQHTPPRKFNVGTNKQICIEHCGDVFLKDNEQVTFVDVNGSEYDVAKKDWGYYATPSLNSRLVNQGFKTALVKNSYGQFYVMIVFKEKLEEFEDYLNSEDNHVVEWLDEKYSMI